MKLFKKALAAAGADDQGEIINDWARELYVNCGGYNRFETQCCSLSGELDKDGRAFIKQLAAFIELREAEMR